MTLTGEVTHLTNGKFIAYGPMGGGLERDYGPSMVFRVGGIDIIVISNNGQAVDLGQFTSLGIDPTRYTTVAVKSMQHFRAAFEPIAREVILVDTGALCSEIYTPNCSTGCAARSGRSTKSNNTAAGLQIGRTSYNYAPSNDRAKARDMCNELSTL